MENIGPIKINCGPYKPATVVLVTFKEGSGDCQCGGEPLSIIFADTKTQQVIGGNKQPQGHRICCHGLPWNLRHQSASI